MKLKCFDEKSSYYSFQCLILEIFKFLKKKIFQVNKIIKVLYMER